MLQIQYIASNITKADQTVHVCPSWNFQALNKLKMGTSFCGVTMTLKRQEKIGNIFFLKTGYIFLQENVCLTLLTKNSHGITQKPTLYVDLDPAFICYQKQYIRNIRHTKKNI